MVVVDRLTKVDHFITVNFMNSTSEVALCWHCDTSVVLDSNSLSGQFSFDERQPTG